MLRPRKDYIKEVIFDGIGSLYGIQRANCIIQIIVI